MTQICVVGSGSVGSRLAKAWSQRGHVVVIGSRSPESSRIRDLVATIGNEVRVASLNDSVDGADVIVLAVPWNAVKESIEALGDLTGRVLIDVTNPFASGLTLELGHTRSGGEQVSVWATGAKVVKALNIVDARLLEGKNLNNREISIPIAGNDGDAKLLASRLISELGFDVVDSGSLESSRLLEPLALLMIRLSMNKNLGNEIGFRVLRD